MSDTNEIPKHVRQAEELREQAEGIRRLADLIEANPNTPASYLPAPIEVNVWFTTSPEQLADIARAALALGAKVDKNATDKVYILKISWGSFIAKALAQRGDVCERVVTGTETIKKTVPDPTALAAVPTVEVIEEIEISEWVCKPLLAAEKAPAVAR